MRRLPLHPLFRRANRRSVSPRLPEVTWPRVRTGPAVTGLALALCLAHPGLAGPQDDSGPRLRVSASVVPERAAPGATVELRVRLDLQDGWHIYDPSFRGTGIPTRLTVKGDALEPVGAPRFPEPTRHRDEVLDETFLYQTGSFEATWAQRVAEGTVAGKHSVTVQVRYQACNDQFCDQPTTASAEASFEVLASTTPGQPEESSDPGGVSAAAQGDGSGDQAASPGIRPDQGLGGSAKDLLGDLGSPGGLGGRKQPRIEWELATRPDRELRRGAESLLVARYDIAEGYHIYAPDHPGIGTRTSVDIDSDEARAIGDLSFPTPLVKTFRSGDTEEVEHHLEGKGELSLPFRILAEVSPGEIQLRATVKFQLCTERSCLTPETRSLGVTVRVSDEDPVSPPAGERGEPGQSSGTGATAGSPVDAGGGGLGDGGLWLFLLSAVGWGLFTLLMPCTYPMIPITISFFTKQAEKAHASTVNMALLYGAGIVLDFVFIGIFVGAPIVQFAQAWWLNLLLGALFVIFALSLFGLFEIRLPSALMNLSGSASQRGGYAGIFILGATLVVTSFTCTAPFVGALLGTATGLSLPWVILGMAVFGATIATPFVALALFPGVMTKLPRSGEWMNTLKVSLGFLELAAALKFLSNTDMALHGDPELLPRELFLLLWTGIALSTGVYLLGLVPLKGGGSHGISPLRLVMAVGVILFGMYCYYGVRADRLNWIMEAIAPPPVAVAAGEGNRGDGARPSNPWTIVRDDFEAGLARAIAEKKLALVNWTGVT